MSASNASLEDVIAVVLEYHRPDDTIRCIQSLANSGLKHIFVWDNSTDSGKTRDMLGEQLAKDEQMKKLVSIAGKNINLGFSAGVNAAISEILKTRTLRYVLLINNDATINPEGSLALLRVLNDDKRNAIAAPEFLNTEKKSHAIMYYHPFFATLTIKKYFGSFAFLSGCCLLVDIEKTGIPLLDEGFFMYGEDVALSKKLQSKGYALAITESARVEHVGAASSVVGSEFYEYHVARGHVVLTSRIAGSRLRALLLCPVRMLSLLARSLLRSFRFQSIRPVSALWRALFSLGPT